MLNTKRLYLRPCQIEDLDSLHLLWTNDAVRKFLFDDRPITFEEVRAFIEASISTFTQDGYGIWLFFELGSDLLAGFVGLLGSSDAPPNLVFGTRPELWKRGYAREVASSVLRYAAEVLGIPRIVADVDEPNRASVRVLEALGLSLTGRAIVNERPLLYYEIINAACKSRQRNCI
jgi:RimJ/RimL family protein N-acetyltransferase